jgi:hypothetical protein
MIKATPTSKSQRRLLISQSNWKEVLELSRPGMVAVRARLLSDGPELPPIQSSPDTDKAAGLERILPLQAAAALDRRIDGMLEALVPTEYLYGMDAEEPGR